MNLYPAIDLYEGKVVRLSRGRFDQKKIYSEFPEKTAQEWERQGASWLHVVDLEGAKTGALKNRGTLVAIRKAVRCRIQFGGGIRKMEDIASLLDAGIDRVVLGTKALEESFLKVALKKFAKKIAVGLDIREGRVQTQGWLTASGQTLEETLKRLEDFPLETVIYTDIQKDGMLQGPNFAGLAKVLRGTRAAVILSGGIGTIEDLKQCAHIQEKNFEGAVIGKALYEKKFSLTEALASVSATPLKK